MRLIDEAARLMGMGPGPWPEPAEQALREAVALAEAPPFHSLTRPCAFSFQGEALLVDGVPVPGRGLARHLAGCRQGVLIGGTLGVEGDRLLKRQSLAGLTQGAAAQAALSARLEWELDRLCQSLTPPAPGLSLTSRFSPGYGDLPLSFQPFLMERLEMGRLGVRLTSGLMMAPSKSVTAVAGWRAGPPSRRCKCAACPNTACPYRKEEADEEADHEIS